MLRKSAVRGGGWLAVTAVALAAAPSFAAELNALSGLSVTPTSQGAQVVVTGSRAPTFTVFRLSDPDRLVVDLASADASAIKGHHDGNGPVIGVVASQFSDARATVGRVLVALDHASQYDVRSDGNRVVISIDGTPAPGSPQVAESAPVQPKVALASAKVPAAAAEPAPVKAASSVAESKPAPAPAKAEPAVAVAEAPKSEPKAAPASHPAEENVVASEGDEREVRHPASKITSFKLHGDKLLVNTDGQVAKYELLELADPPRLALDVYGVGLSARVPKAHSAHLKDVRAGAHADKVRVVLDVDGDMPRYHVGRTARGLELSLKAGAVEPAPMVAEAPKPIASKAAAEEGAPEMQMDGKDIPLDETAAVQVKPAPVDAPKAHTAKVEVKDLAFNDQPQGGRIELRLSGETTWKVEHPDEHSLVLTLDHASIPKRLERSLDTSALTTPVKMVSAFAVPGEERVRVVVATAEKLDDQVVKLPGGMAWKLATAGVKSEQVAVSPKTAGMTVEAQSYASEGAPRAKGYTGKRVSFEFKDIDIHNLLRVIAEVSKKNVVVADDVTGKVTIRLRNVPWDQALELILRSKGLGKEEMGNIIRVAPLKTLEEEAKIRESRNASLKRQEELVVQLIPVNYASAGDMANRVKDVLTERGSVTVDARTNVLIVRDVGSNIARARSLVASLDTQTPQVLIESRIVEAGTNSLRSLGVQWGGVAQAAPGTGNPTGLIFPNTVSVRGGSTPDNNQGVSADPNFAVNLPVAVGAGSGGALGFVFGSAGGAFTLNLRLSALETQGSVKTISAPKVTTLDNDTARISQGVSIPYSQVSAAGVNTIFIEARLSLEVTPHITSDGSVMMRIKAENNQPDPSQTGANGQPAIQKKEAQTQVLVKDGDTTVIGGIYVRRGSSSENGVPFLSKIPILGFFFKSTSESDSRQELLIFITPRILNRQTIAQNL